MNNAQRQALTDQINHSDNITSVNHIKDNANVVNTAMTGLKQSVADNNSEIQQGNYINRIKINKTLIIVQLIKLNKSLMNPIKIMFN